jgi:multidrug efflux pump subunit AcrA (membrane-fusion protein)
MNSSDLRTYLRGLLLSAGILMQPGCGRNLQHDSALHSQWPPAHVCTRTVENRTVPVFEEVVGTVRAKRRATMEAKVTGRITERPLALGQKFRSGDLLVRLDAPEIKARLDQAEAGSQQAERDWKRVAAWFAQHTASRAELDPAEGRYLMANGAVAEARAAGVCGGPRAFRRGRGPAVGRPG